MLCTQRFESTFSKRPVFFFIRKLPGNFFLLLLFSIRQPGMIKGRPGFPNGNSHCVSGFKGKMLQV
ncbi:MAG TPA: hypothetical protein DCQ97_10140 [Chitinophagaceae bacterium]|nr:hypothetical protein [Chitinophagaceae bacterium]